MNAATPKKFTKDDVLFQEGAPSKSLYIVQKGVVSIRKRKLGGYIEVAKITPGEVLGELSFFDRQPRSASAIALTPVVEVIEVDFVGLDKIFAAVPGYMQTIMRSLAERLRKADDSIRRLEKNVIRTGKEENPEDAGVDSTSAINAAINAADGHKQVSLAGELGGKTDDSAKKK